MIELEDDEGREGVADVDDLVDVDDVVDFLTNADGGQVWGSIHKTKQSGSCHKSESSFNDLQKSSFYKKIKQVLNWY